MGTNKVNEFFRMDIFEEAGFGKLKMMKKL